METDMSMNSAAIMQKMDAIEWQIQVVRDEIARGWAKLATKGLSFEARQPIREHLLKNISTLHQLVAQSQSASKTADLRVHGLRINAAEEALGVRSDRVA